MSELKENKHEMPFGPIIEIPEWVPPEQVAGIMAVFDTDADGVISAQEAKADAAHESLFQVLTKLGASPEALKEALGIEPAAERSKQRKLEKDNRDKMRGGLGRGVENKKEAPVKMPPPIAKENATKQKVATKTK
jgi:hypothetical protein